MRRRYPWWALLATTALVMASSLAPMEGAAYRIPEGHPDAVNRGDPDNPAGTKSQPASRESSRGVIAVALQPLPGVVIHITVPSRLTTWMQSCRGTSR